MDDPGFDALLTRVAETSTRMRIAMAVTTVLALTTTAVGTTNVRPTATCRGIYLSTGGTLTYKLQNQDDARARILGVGYHPLKITEITSMGACVGEFYW